MPSLPITTLQTQFTGGGDYDTVSKTWSNPSAVPGSGQGASYGLNGTVAGTVQLTGTIAYSTSYTLLGNPNFSSTSSNPTTVDGQYVPEVTIDISFSLVVGVGFSLSATGSAQATAQQYSITLQE